MEALLRNVSDTAELLAVAARSSEVRHWDQRSVCRAFAWARYCEQLFSRFHGHAAVRQQLEAQLQLTNHRLHAAFPGHGAVSFPQLCRCRHLLLVGLLHNPELPVHVTRLLFDTRGSLGQQQGVSGVCSSLIQVRSACRTLRPVTLTAAGGAGAAGAAGGAAGAAGGAAGGADADADADAGAAAVQVEMLEEAPLEPGRARCLLLSLLSLLQGGEGSAQCVDLLAALLTGRTSSVLSECVMECVLQPELLELLCSRLPGPLLADVCRQQASFREAYCSLLSRWVSLLEFSVTEGRWRQPGLGSSVTFEEVSQRFVSLLEACPHLRRTVEQQLAALKASDGDFDVPGVSVWGDLLSQIRSRT